MNNALWLILALPEWYFATVLAPLSASYLSLIPAIGVLSFLAGIGVGIYKRALGLWLFCIPFGLCEALVAFAGLKRGQIADTVSTPILLSFLALVVAISIWAVWRLESARLPATLLSVFTVTLCFVCRLYRSHGIQRQLALRSSKCLHLCRLQTLHRFDSPTSEP